MSKKVTKNELIIMAISIVLIVIMGLFWFEQVNFIDLQILKFIRNYITFDVLKNIMDVISILLSPIPMLLMFGIFIILGKDKLISKLVAINTILAVIFNFIFKNIFRRPRPFEYMLGDVSGYSFPSAHAMVGVAFYGTLLYLNNKFIKDKKLKISINILLWILIIMTPISRVYLGVHNFSDIFIGSVLGMFIVRTSIYFLNKISNEDRINRLEESK